MMSNEYENKKGFFGIGIYKPKTKGKR